MNKFLFSLFFTIISFSLCAQRTAAPPRLVIGIMIDGIEQQRLQDLWSQFPWGGFKRIAGEGACFNNMSYNQMSAGISADAASVVTGSVPYYHGITGEMFYNRSKNTTVSIVADEIQAGGSQALQPVSANKLLVSTVVDELKMTYSGAKAYSIGVDMGATIMLGGHAANGAIWLDNTFMRWASTNYYPEGLTKYAQEMNTNGEFEQITSQIWTRYKYSYNYHQSNNSFRHQATNKLENSTATILKNTPAANELVTKLALKIVEGEQLGVDGTPDMLMLQYTLQAPDNKRFSAEKEDMYFRLDSEISTLLSKIYEKLNKENVLVVMFGSQTAVRMPADLGQNNVPAGYFNANSSIALLNTYLMALYGQERWVTGYYGKNIFLNHEKIEEKRMKLSEVQRTVAAFMHEFEGIHTAFPTTDILLSSTNGDGTSAQLRNSIHKKTAGDVIITLLPGWIELDNEMNPIGTTTVAQSIPPVYFSAWKTRMREIDTPCNINDITATLCKFLNIPYPNACTGKAIKEVTER